MVHGSIRPIVLPKKFEIASQSEALAEAFRMSALMLSKVKAVMTPRSSNGNSSSPSENQETVPPPPKIGMVVDMAAESNVIAELLSGLLIFF